MVSKFLNITEINIFQTSIYNGKINYIAGLCNVDISVRKQQYYALESAKRHVWRAEEKFDKYFSVLKSQIPEQDSNLQCIVENKNYKLESQGYKVCHWYMYQSVYFCKQKKTKFFS